ncbi:MAG: TMEM198/TM7SF3 family protein [Eubacterium sp.]|nr:TMEM198/TM7SF3 family protein [Eubacterium sp.]
MTGPISEIMSGLTEVLAVGSLILGILQCFFGFRLLRFWISVTGFLLGLYLGRTISSDFISEPQYAPWLIGAVCGFLLCFFAYRIYLSGVFIFCGILAASVIRMIPFPEGHAWKVVLYILMAAGFVLAGVLAVKFSRPAVIFITAGAGAAVSVHALALMKTNISGNPDLQKLVIAVLFAAGAAVQFLTSRRNA